jgi:hypothetical protein
MKSFKLNIKMLLHSLLKTQLMSFFVSCIWIFYLFSCLIKHFKTFHNTVFSKLLMALPSIKVILNLPIIRRWLILLVENTKQNNSNLVIDNDNPSSIFLMLLFWGLTGRTIERYDRLYPLVLYVKRP